MKFETPHQKFCFENAVYFTAVRGMRPQTRTREEFPTFAEACAYGENIGDRRTMIYAVTAEGRFEHICNR